MDGSGESVPGLLFGLESGPAGFGKRVELGAAVVLGLAPICFYPCLMLEAVERGIEGALVDTKDVIRELTHAIGYCEAVHGSESQHLEDEEVEGALQEFIGFCHYLLTSIIEVKHT
jgi:hypothetical protein